MNWPWKRWGKWLLRRALKKAERKARRAARKLERAAERKAEDIVRDAGRKARDVIDGDRENGNERGEP